MTRDADFEDINEAKANMDYIYNQSDPRANFRLGCSYGVNAALLKHDLSMDELYEHWGQDTMSDVAPEEVVARDQRYFSELGEPEDIAVVGLDIAVVGLDIADKAISFGEYVGLLDESFAVNLETDPVSPLLKEELAPIDLVTSTGCVGYVTEKSFNRLLPAVTPGQLPWLANFVLRLFPFDAIEECLSEWGYVTEKLENQAFFQRRFVSMDEQEQVIDQLREQGLDPTGHETEGDLLAEFYLSRPAEDAAACPIEQLLAVQTNPPAGFSTQMHRPAYLA